MDPDARCFAIAAGQFGVLHLDQARKAGLSPRAVRLRVERGTLRRLYPRVFGVVAVPESFEQHAMAAALYAGPGSALGFQSAAYMWGLVDHQPSCIDVWTPRNLRTEGLRLHRMTGFAKGDLTRLGALPVTDPSRTLMDLAAVLDESPLEEILHVGLTKGRPYRDRLERRLDVRETRGKKGIGVLSGLLHLFPDRAPESIFETRVFRGLRTLGRPYPVPQYA